VFTIPNGAHFASLRLFGHVSKDDGTEGKVFDKQAMIRRQSGQNAELDFNGSPIETESGAGNSFSFATTTARSGGTGATQTITLKINQSGESVTAFVEMMVEMLNSKASGITMASA